MNLFWQIVIVEFLLNVAVFAGVVIAYGPVCRRIEHFGPMARGTALATMFAACTALTMLLPIHLDSGTLVGGQVVLIGIAAPFGGPFAAIAAAVVAVAAASWLGGETSLLGAAISAFGAAFAGMLVAAGARRLGRTDGYAQFAAIGGLVAIAGLSTLFLIPESDAAWNLLAQSAAPTIVSSIGGSILLGTLLLHERRRHEMEQALRVSESRYRLLADNATDVICRYRLDFTPIYVSPAVSEVLGYEPAAFLEMGSFALLHPDDVEAARSAVASLREGQPATVIHRLRRADGSHVWLEASLRRARAAIAADADEIVSVLRDISERRAAEEERNAKLAAQEASRQKSQFLANMSHELRTPLNAIIGFSDLIQTESFGPLDPTYVDFATDINQSGAHLLAVINDILDFSKAEIGPLEMNEDLVDVPAALRASLRMTQPRIAEKNLTLETRIPDGMPALRGDERRIKQIAINLLSNAVKFTPDGGRIVVTAAVNGDGELVLAVQDSGIGIGADEIAKVFEPFYQAEAGLARRFEGTGLGLPIVKRLVEMHSGQIELSSTPGEGTLVTIRFPADRLQSPHNPELMLSA
jgi:cell cycle sensor histidine kinase DivJ